MNQPQAFTSTHKTLFAAALSSILILNFWPTVSEPASTHSFKLMDRIQSSITSIDNTLQTGLDSQPLPTFSVADDPNTVIHQIKSGDTLSSIFNASNAPQSDLYKIMEEDLEYLSLATLQPGATLILSFDDKGSFSELLLQIDVARKITFTKQQDGSFKYQKHEMKTHWVSEVLRGSIDGSLYTSALRAGLNKGQIALIGQLLESRLNFKRSLRSGDGFTVIVGHEMTGDQATKKTRLEAIVIERGVTSHYAFRFRDGNYYDENGNSVTPAFLRRPTQKSFRVSSHFNNNRRHPITKRLKPHNGVDFAAPIGTPILSIGDGVVKRIGNHPYAGKYVEIEHGGSYTTRHLHLSKVLVRQGSKVKRGQQIAKSGNTGRSTGPHLHFELHINGKPVNPLTADIPTAARVPSKEFTLFEQEVEKRLEVMEYAASRSNLLLAQNSTSSYKG
ncbi:peptidoglycan DD-metalloendopeptidase family protein [Oceanospirillum maris]|uniref:peptidoglycan DD-metalloendopeptidase family protein n=1 Tax=Oceanospirillum maris TaxID=64977 RepID=UPI0003FEBFAF|nr:peptidoglycan DD-metalloendopeptidase family protein [Oceanospirillum maris]